MAFHQTNVDTDSKSEEAVIEAKRTEISEYSVQVSDWELDRYLETF